MAENLISTLGTNPDGPIYVSLVRPRSPPDGIHDSKRTKFDSELVPWLAAEAEGLEELTPFLRKTRRQLAEWAKDYSAVFLSVTHSLHYIAFPATEWKAIIKGKVVDFDKVHTHRPSIIPSAKCSKQLATGIDIVVDDSETPRHISNVTDWEEAWRRFYTARLSSPPTRIGSATALKRICCLSTVGMPSTLIERSRSRSSLNEFHRFGHFETSFTQELGTGLNA
ncbi:hypothetical protein APHAL10511_001455 [Amanita phalloides]|nr:hypothetical protein APHAL10511_001455 [Amanita phalloides]